MPKFRALLVREWSIRAATVQEAEARAWQQFEDDELPAYTTTAVQVEQVSERGSETE